MADKAWEACDGIYRILYCVLDEQVCKQLSGGSALYITRSFLLLQYSTLPKQDIFHPVYHCYKYSGALAYQYMF